MTYARLTAVYGIPYESINNMPIAAITNYLNKIPAVLAERRLVAADGASIPHAKDAKKIMKQWQTLAYGDTSSKRVASPAQLRLLGIGVGRVN
jgi:hypothetical protein